MSKLVFSLQLDLNITVVPRIFAHLVLISTFRLEESAVAGCSISGLQETSSLTCAAVGDLVVAFIVEAQATKQPRTGAEPCPVTG